MNKPNQETKQSNVATERENSSLKGTLIFVLFVGSFILVSWFAIFFIYLSRT